MSFKILFASTFGLIKSTAKVESAHQALLNDYTMYSEFEKSSDYKEFQELEHIVNADTFKQKKKEIQQLVLKGSKEDAQLKEFHKLGKNSRLHKFYILHKSEELKKFDQIAVSESMKKYKELKTGVEKHSLAALKKMDKQTKEYILYSEFVNLHDSPDLTFFRDFRKSAGYRNYELMLESPERKRFEELQKLTASDDFKARVAYLEDKQKWEKTADSAKEKRFAELSKMPQVANFLKYKNSNAFDFFRKWTMVFEDRFDSDKLDTQKWITQSYLANKTLGQNFSQAGDLNAFTEGKNIWIDGKLLNIMVRREQAKGMQWQIPFGFIEKEFEYTSGIVSTGAIEWWKHGILEAKVKYSPSHNLVNAIYLLGEESSPQINLVEMGVKNRLGLLTKLNDGINAECESISGLKTGEFYIFRLEWTAHSLVWKINDREILNLTHNIPAFKMHLNAASVVVGEPSGNLPHRFEIDWVRFYQNTH